MTVPQRRILTQKDLHLWLSSPTYNELLEFVTSLAAAVKGKPSDAECEVSPVIDGLKALLAAVDQINDAHPVQDTVSSRFGKPEFRDFYDELASVSKKLLLEHIPQLSEDQAIELSTYLNESFGNRTRIDFGSGHELNFMALLLALNKLQIIRPADYPALVLQVFTKYMSTMRTLQLHYWLEPAGSHGVWGLDDYHFLPFLFGASQLATHPHLRPKSIHNQDMIEMFYKKYMYFECIHFINSVKTTTSLRWHSPMLDDISGAKTWAKVAEGMVKMFKAEVLAKLPIIQHFFFGSILKAPEGCTPLKDNKQHIHTDACNHADHDSDEGIPPHQHTWGDCCGIKIPSAIGARQLSKPAGTNKPLPFD